MQFLWDGHVTLFYYGGSTNDYRFDELVLRLPKQYVFLKMNGENDFMLIKDLLGEEEYKQDQLLIAQNQTNDIEKRFFSDLQNYEEIVRYLEKLRTPSTRDDNLTYKTEEL